MGNLCMKANRSGPKYTHWKGLDSSHATADSIKYLRLGYEGHPITIGTHQLPDNTPYTALLLREYQPLSPLSLIDGCYYYHRPSSSSPSDSEETLGSFIYEANNKTVTIFQVTVSRKNSVTQGGIEWLQSLGVETFRFVAVTAPKTPLDVSFPNEWRSGVVPSIPDKYVLVLDSLYT